MGNPGLRILAAVAALAGCGGVTQPQAAIPIAGPDVMPHSPSLAIWMGFARGTAARPKLTYVSEFDATTVSAYTSDNRKNEAPVCQSGSVHDPEGIATDRFGNLYAAVGFSGFRGYGIATFAPSCGKAGPTFNEDLGLPEDPAVDGRTLYLTNLDNGSLPVTVLVYNIDAGSQPVGELTDPSAGEGLGVAVNSHHDLFWSTTNALTGHGQVIEFRKGRLPGRVLKATFMNSGFPGGVLFDKSDNLLFVVQASAPAIYIFAPPYDAPPASTISLKASAVYCTLSVDQRQIFCLDYSNGSVDAYAYPKGTYLYSYTSGIESSEDPIGIAVQ